MTNEIFLLRAWVMAALAASRAAVAKGLLTKAEVLTRLPPVSGIKSRAEEDAIIATAREMIEEWPDSGN